MAGKVTVFENIVSCPSFALFRPPIRALAISPVSSFSVTVRTFLFSLYLVLYLALLLPRLVRALSRLGFACFVLKLPLTLHSSVRASAGTSRSHERLCHE